MILNITSYPRSGNSFFTTTLLSFDPVWKVAGQPATFKPVGSLFSDELAGQGISKVPYYNKKSGDIHPMPRLQENDSVYVYKRHDDPDYYVGPRIYIVRDGRDVITSYAHHNLVHGRVMKNLEAGRPADHNTDYSQDELHDEMRKLAVHSRWGEFVLKGIRHPNVVAVVRYEDMKKDPKGTVKDALREAGIMVTEKEDLEHEWDFKRLRKQQPWFYRRGQARAFVEELPDDIQDYFEKVPLNRAALQTLGYEV